MLNLWAVRDSKWEKELFSIVQSYQMLHADKSVTSEYNVFLQKWHTKENWDILSELSKQDFKERTDEEIQMMDKITYDLSEIASKGSMLCDLGISGAKWGLESILKLYPLLYQHNNRQVLYDQKMKVISRELKSLHQVRLYPHPVFLLFLQRMKDIYIQLYWNMLLDEQADHKIFYEILSNKNSMVSLQDIVHNSVCHNYAFYRANVTSKSIKPLYYVLFGDLKDYSLEHIREKENRNWLLRVRELCRPGRRDLYFMQPTALPATRIRFKRILETEPDFMVDPEQFSMLKDSELPIDLRFMIALDLKKKFGNVWNLISQHKRLWIGAYLLEQYQKNGTLSEAVIPESAGEISEECRLMMGTKAVQLKAPAYKVIDTKNANPELVKRYCWKITLDLMQSLNEHRYKSLCFLGEKGEHGFSIALWPVHDDLQQYEKALAPLFTLKNIPFEGVSPSGDRIEFTSKKALHFTNIPQKLLVVEYGGEESVFILER